tara:strand:+ start:3287 stop:3406 length:120 start_codon:yes stop_codon:yes gene_type:complete
MIEFMNYELIENGIRVLHVIFMIPLIIIGIIELNKALKD